MSQDGQHTVIPCRGSDEEDRSRDLLVDFRTSDNGTDYVQISRRGPLGESLYLTMDEWDTFATAISDLRLMDEVERVNNQR